MNKETKQRWVEALRSGRYYLEHVPTLCHEASSGPIFNMYGVLCDVLQIPYTTKNSRRYYGAKQRSASLPQEVAEVLGLPPNTVPFTFIDTRLAARFTKIPHVLQRQNYLMLEELAPSPRVLANIIENATWRGRP